MADEDRPRAALAQRLRDADAVQCRAEARFRKQRDGRSRRGIICRSARAAMAGRTGAPRLAACGRWLRDNRRCSRIRSAAASNCLRLELVEYGEMFARRLL